MGLIFNLFDFLIHVSFVFRMYSMGHCCLICEENSILISDPIALKLETSS